VTSELGEPNEKKQTWSIEGATVSIDSGKLEVVLSDGRRHRYPVTWSKQDGSVIIATPLGSLRLQAKRGSAALAGLGGAGRNIIKSSMPGKIVRILCKRGDAVTAEQPLLIIEAMKMENEIRAPLDGIVEEISVQEGQKVETGALLLRLEAK
jgi:biotin carboxyl carrier protein